jgi:ABC-2 type transport system permease protein
MQNILKIALNDLRVYLSDTGNVVSLLVVPVVLTIILGFAFGEDGGGGAVQRLRVDLIDQAQNSASEEFIATLQELDDTLVLCPLDENEDGICAFDEGQTTLTVEQATTRLDDGIVSSVIVLPANLGDESLDSVSIGYYSRADIQSGDPVLQSVNAVIQRLNAVYVAQRTAQRAGENFVEDITIFRDTDDRAEFIETARQTANELIASQPVTIDTISVNMAETDLRTENFGRQGFGQSVPGMGSMFVMFVAFAGLTLLVRERNQWTLQRLIVMPLPRWQILAGKICAYVALGMVQYGIVFAVGLFFGADLGSEPLGLILLMLSYVICVTALAFALGVFLRNEEQINSVSLLLTLTLAPLGGAWWPLEITPQFMQIIGHISPIAWAMDGFRSLIFYGGTLTDVLLPVAVLLGASLVFLVIGARYFRYE